MANVLALFAIRFWKPFARARSFSISTNRMRQPWYNISAAQFFKLRATDFYWNG